MKKYGMCRMRRILGNKVSFQIADGGDNIRTAVATKKSSIYGKRDLSYVRVSSLIFSIYYIC